MLRSRTQIRKENLFPVVMNDRIANRPVRIVEQRADFARREIENAKRAAVVRTKGPVVVGRRRVIAEIRVPVSVDTRFTHGKDDFVNARHTAFFELLQEFRRRGRIELLERLFAFAQRNVVVIKPASVFKRDFDDVRSLFDRARRYFNENRLKLAAVVCFQIELARLIDRDDRTANLFRRRSVCRHADHGRFRPVRKADAHDEPEGPVVIARAFKLNFKRVAISKPAVFHCAEMPCGPKFIGRLANDLPPDFFALLLARFAPVVEPEPEFAAASVRNAKLKDKIVVSRIVTRVDRRLLLSAKTGRAKRKGCAYET